MKLFRWESIRKLRELLRETAPSPREMRQRLRTVERDVILPIKAILVLVLCYSFYVSPWIEPDVIREMPERFSAQTPVQYFFLIYLVFSVGVALALVFPRRLPARFLQLLILSSSLLDGFFMAVLTFVTGGADSLAYWMFLGLIVRNALSSPLASSQLVLNLLISLFYLAVGLWDLTYPLPEPEYDAGGGVTGNPAEALVLRVVLLWVWAVCCYGMQVLLEKQRRAAEETQEFFARQEQLHSAGRLAAEIAHQIKNPLGIINNAAYSLQCAIEGGRQPGLKQVRIIREEVERADSIITQLMGYAQLAEGRVEKLEVAEELDRAIATVFPPGAKFGMAVEKHYEPDLPPLLMQRGHLSEILVNVLKNAREATNSDGGIQVVARQGPDNVVVITVADSGPGIPPDRLEKVFEPYFSTKDRGTGLGLSIVRHNIEMYGGRVRAESELGNGARFVLDFPTRTFMKVKS
jgi:signal transduction histidine kinase